LHSDFIVRSDHQNSSHRGFDSHLIPPSEGGQEIDSHCKIIDGHGRISDPQPDLHTKQGLKIILLLVMVKIDGFLWILSIHFIPDIDHFASA
jgi:hypothetical protein